MSRRRFAVSLVFTLAAAGFVAGCSDPQRTGPSEMFGPSDRVVSIEIQGPEFMAPGQSAQFNAIEHLSSGTTRALASAEWISSDPSLLLITSSGLATAQSRIGEVRVSIRTASAFKAVLVRRFVSGDYTLTLESGSNCSVPLAVELRRRSYDATVTQNGTRLEVVLTEPRFVIPDDTNGRFSGTVTSTGATFHIDGGWTSGSNLIERLPDGSALEIYGTAHTTESSGVLSGSLSGWFNHYGAVGPYLGDCNASTFTLTRR